MPLDSPTGLGAATFGLAAGFGAKICGAAFGAALFSALPTGLGPLFWFGLGFGFGGLFPCGLPCGLPGALPPGLFCLGACTVGLAPTLPSAFTTNGPLLAGLLALPSGLGPRFALLLGFGFLLP